MKMNMKKRVLAGILVGAMMLSVSGCGTEQKADNAALLDGQEQSSEMVLTTAEQDTLGELGDMVKTSINLENVLDGEKDETVYVIADSTGNRQSVIVSEWLKNSKGEDEIKDRSTLTDIENVKGEETFTQDGEELTWKANGNPIYYQGKSDKEIPIGVKVRYFLNDEEMTPEEIAGKSGTVKMVFEYTNNAKVGEVYAPFLMGTGLLLDGENYSNVQVSHGKVIADGNRFIVVGIGLPGMQENLDLNIEGLEFPSSVEVTANTTNFKLDMALTLGMPLAISEDSLNIDLDELKAKLHEKTDAFADGVDKLADGVKTYVDGVNQVADGIGQVNDGAVQLADGAGKLDSAMQQAKAGASKLADGSGQLNNAVKDINLPNVSSYSAQTTDAQKAAAAAEIKKNVEAKGYTSDKVSNAMTKGVTDALSAAPSFGKLAQEGLTDADKEAAIKAEAAAKGAASVTDDLKAKIAQDAAAKGAASVTDELKAKIAQDAAAKGAASVTDDLKAKIAQDAAAKGAASVTDELKGQIAQDAAQKAQTAAGLLAADPSKVTGDPAYQQAYATVKAQIEAAAYVTAINQALAAQGLPISYDDLNAEQIAQYKAALADQVNAAVNQQMQSIAPALVGAFTAGYGSGYGNGY